MHDHDPCLDCAWARAEAALPEGLGLSLHSLALQGWAEAVATNYRDPSNDISASASSPAAALDALASALEGTNP